MLRVPRSLASRPAGASADLGCFACASVPGEVVRADRGSARHEVRPRDGVGGAQDTEHAPREAGAAEPPGASPPIACWSVTQ